VLWQFTRVRYERPLWTVRRAIRTVKWVAAGCSVSAISRDFNARRGDNWGYKQTAKTTTITKTTTTTTRLFIFRWGTRLVGLNNSFHWRYDRRSSLSPTVMIYRDLWIAQNCREVQIVQSICFVAFVRFLQGRDIPRVLNIYGFKRDYFITKKLLLLSMINGRRTG